MKRKATSPPQSDFARKYLKRPTQPVIMPGPQRQRQPWSRIMYKGKPWRTIYKPPRTFGSAGYWKARYTRRRVTGRGDYNFNPGDSFGRRYGGLLGSKAGELLGGLGQSLFTSVTGMGDYKVKSNVLGGDLPTMVNVPSGGGTIIRFKEYLKDIRTGPGPDTFSIESFLINGSNPATFPFLSQIAANYEQYSVEGVLFEFRSTSANALNSVNTALGSVMMATQYDVLDPQFTSKQEMLNYEFSTSVKPSQSGLHMVECARNQTPVTELYSLYNQEVPSTGDPRLYHLGRFSIATTGFQGSDVNIGELHVTYQVRLLKPKLYTSLGNTSSWSSRLVNNIGAAGAYSNIAPLGQLNNIVDALDEITNQPLIFNNQNLLTLPASAAILKYYITVNWLGLTPQAIQFPTITFENCSVSFTDEIPASATNSATMNWSASVTTFGNGLTPGVRFANDGLYPTDPQKVHMRVSQTPGNLLQ